MGWATGQACGKPWARMVEHTKGPDRPNRRQGRSGDTIREAHGQDARAGKRITLLSTTTGWQPTCDCGAGHSVPAIVLDPFLGSGTTCRVAERLGRHAVGLDLSWAYLSEIAAPRCAAPMQQPLAGMA
ncbi:MAG: hypothetical protein HY794_16680 [Desulfarculus sp.]|nr:hypothetical protein [Desulfarculus sp.]